MAEALTVIGGVASIVQLLEVTHRFSKRLSHFLSKTNEAPESFHDINLHLPLFRETLRQIQFSVDHGQYNSPQTGAILQRLVDECTAQMVLLENDILRNIIPEEGDSKMIRSRKAIYSLRHERSIIRTVARLSACMQKLSLFHITTASSYSMSQVKAVQELLHHCLQDRNDGMDGSRNSTENRDKVRKRVARRQGQQRRRFVLNLNLSSIGVYFTIQAGLELFWGSRGCTIAPTLQVQRLVKYTSPGFEVFWQCERGHMDVETGCRMLVRLFQDRKASPFDIDPGGKSWLEKVLTPKLNVNHQVRFAFLKVLAQCGSQTSTKESLSTLCARWSSMGPHLTFLDELLAVGYDLSADNFSSPFNLNETAPFSSSTLGLSGGFDCTPDRFLLKFLRRCSKDTHGFWGQTPLMDAILSGTITDIKNSLEKSCSLDGRNDLGQSAVHLAVLCPNALSHILKRRINLNLQDNEGYSPLIYAAAYGCIESVILLLKAGACPISVDESGSKHIEFLDHARRWRHWEVITDAIRYLRASSSYSSNFISGEVDYLMARYMREFWMGQSANIKLLLELGANPNLILDGGNTLLHGVCGEAEAVALFDAGFKNIDYQNARGRTALMSAIQWGSYGLCKAIMARGAKVNQQDNNGTSALHMMCRKLRNIGGSAYYGDTSAVLWRISEKMVKIAMLLDQCADPLIRDGCRCPCSPEGCSPSTYLLSKVAMSSSYGYIWTLHWLLSLKEFQGPSTAQKALTDLIRVTQFNSLGMTHVCCQRKTKYPGPMEEEEINEILSEEKYIRMELEDKMGAVAEYDENFLETWLELLIKSYAHREDPTESRWTWGVWRGEEDNISFLSATPPPWEPRSKYQGSSNAPLLKAQPALQPNYYIDAHCDEFREERGPMIVPQVASIRLYSAWVDYFFEHHVEYDYPTKIDTLWYNERKYWASRQAEALEKSAGLSQDDGYTNADRFVVIDGH